MDSIVGFIVGLFKLAVFLLLIVAAIAFWGYNKIRRLAENVKEKWSNISVVTRKKISLINQLIDVVKGYQESEKLIMLKVSDDLTMSAMQQMYQQSGTLLSTISGMVQRFPELKANEQYNRLADSIQRAENDLENARTRYNEAAKEFNVMRTSIPHVFYSRALGFQEAPYLNLDAVESEDASVQKPMISDDGERVNLLFEKAGNKVLGAAKNLAVQGKTLAEKGAARIQAGVEEEFYYLDTEKIPKGPVSRAELNDLFQAGTLTAQSDVLKNGTKGWIKYQDL
jgi:LemA protein